MLWSCVVLPLVFKKSNEMVKIMIFTPDPKSVLAPTWIWLLIDFSWTFCDKFELLLNPKKHFEFKGIYCDFNFFDPEVNIEFDQFFFVSYENLQLFSIFLGPWVMDGAREGTWDTFDGFRIAFGGFLSQFLTPVIKVTGNLFFIPGLF